MSTRSPSPVAHPCPDRVRPFPGGWDTSIRMVRRHRRPHGGSHGWTVTDVASTRRVAVTDFAGARAAGPWDLVVLSTRPGELDPQGASAIRRIAPRHIAIPSQVEGDLDRARTEFPAAEVVVFAPLFLSERAEAGAAPSGREVRYWAPIGAPRFLLAGRAAAVRRLARGLGRLALPAPTSAVVL